MRDSLTKRKLRLGQVDSALGCLLDVGVLLRKRGLPAEKLRDLYLQAARVVEAACGLEKR